jgi:hypothetical protein
MREHETELIAALVEGRLEDESEARALIESSEEARAEYQAQRIALEALSGVGPAEMTEHERAALRRDVWTALRIGEGSGTPARMPWYLRWSYVAAALFVVVGLVAVLSQAGGDDSGDDAVQLAADTATTTLADSGATRAQDGDEAFEESDEQSEAMTDGADALEAAPAIDTNQMSEYATQLRSGELDLPEETEGQDECLESAGLTDHRVVAEIEMETRYLVVLPADESPGAETPITFVDADTCEVVFIDH